LKLHQTNIFMTVLYELKGRHEVCYKAKIGLTGLIVNSKAKNLNFKARTTESKTYSSSKLQLEAVAHQVDIHSTYRIGCF